MATAAPPSAPTGPLALLLSCPKCGGPFTIDDESASYECDHCGSLLLLSAPERDEIYLADEAFLTGTAAEVTPIRELDDRRVGAGTPGPVTGRLQELFFAIVRGREERYRTWLAFV